MLQRTIKINATNFLGTIFISELNNSLSRLPSIEVKSFDDLQPLVDLHCISFSGAEYKNLIHHIFEKQNRLPDFKILNRATTEGTEWKLWLPSDMTLDVINRAHSPPLCAHAGIAKTLAKLRLNFFSNFAHDCFKM